MPARFAYLGRQRLWLGQLARVELALVATVVAALVDMDVEFGVDGFDVVAVCAHRFVGGTEIGEEGGGCWLERRVCRSA